MKPTKKPLRGKALLKAAWNWIALHPQKWNQTSPFMNDAGCGCLGAHADRIAGSPDPLASQGFKLCGLDHYEGRGAYLFSGYRTMKQLRAGVIRILGTSKGVKPVPKAKR